MTKYRPAAVKGLIIIYINVMHKLKFNFNQISDKQLNILFIFLKKNKKGKLTLYTKVVIVIYILYYIIYIIIWFLYKLISTKKTKIQKLNG